MPNFSLACGVTLEYEYVPAVYARAIAHTAFPGPARPTRKIEVGPGVFDEREYDSPEYRRALAHYDDFVWPVGFRLAIIDVAVLDESVPPIDQALLARRRARVPKELHFTDKADWIVMGLMQTTYGDKSEFFQLAGAVLTNDFTLAEVEQVARAMKSEG